MGLAWIGALQAGVAAAATAPAPIPFDLARLAPPPGEFRIGCPERRGGAEITVCARRRGEGYPMAEMERRYGGKPLRAEAGIGGGAIVRSYVEQVELGAGQVSKRAMIGIKLPF